MLTHCSCGSIEFEAAETFTVFRVIDRQLTPIEHSSIDCYDFIQCKNCGKSHPANQFNFNTEGEGNE